MFQPVFFTSSWNFVTVSSANVEKALRQHPLPICRTKSHRLAAFLRTCRINRSPPQLCLMLAECSRRWKMATLDGGFCIYLMQPHRSLLLLGCVSCVPVTAGVSLHYAIGASVCLFVFFCRQTTLHTFDLSAFKM